MHDDHPIPQSGKYSAQKRTFWGHGDVNCALSGRLVSLFVLLISLHYLATAAVALILFRAETCPQRRMFPKVAGPRSNNG